MHINAGSVQHPFERGPSEQRKRQLSDELEHPRKRLKHAAENMAARRKLHFPHVATSSPPVTVSYILILTMSWK